MSQQPKVGAWLALPRAEYGSIQLKRKLELQAVVSDMAPVQEPSQVVRLWEEDRDFIYVPRRTGFVPDSVLRGALDCTEPGESRDMGPPILLREGQIQPVERVMQALAGTDYLGGQIHAPAGAGKTVLGLEVARRLGRTTVVLVHKEFFLNQWRERIEQHLPQARVGYVQQNRCDFGDDYDIVIAMIQSLASRRYPDEFHRWPGLLISDETHRLGAETWHPVVTKFPARTRLGLTATPRRKDGMAPAFFWHIGPILVSIPREQTKVMKPYVKLVPYSGVTPGYFQTRAGTFNSSRWLTAIAENARRNDLLLSYLLAALDKGRKVIALSARRGHLGLMEKLVKAQRPHITVGHYVGSSNQADLDAAAQCNLVLATYQMAAEGLDVPDLDCAVFMTPMSDVEQAVGRVQRFVEGKRQPIVIDVVDTQVDYARRLLRGRRRVYAAVEAEVH